MPFANSGLAYHRGSGFDAEKTPPKFLFLQTNKRCNLKCEHCSFWKLDDDDRANYLDRSARRRVVDEFADMNPCGAVVICGGESMLDLEDYFDLSKACREARLTCLSVVNGTRIRTSEMAERMIQEGPHEISVSLNSHRAELHDETRGVTGSFATSVNALRLLLEARRRLGGTSRIYVMGLIFDKNYLELPDFFEFVLRDIRADKLKLNFIQPSFGDAERDTFFASNSAIDPDVLIEKIGICGQRFGIEFNPKWVETVWMYFRSLQGITDLEKGWQSRSRTAEHICNTYERNIMVDHYGMAKLCFSTDFRGSLLRQSGDLRRFWLEANDIRQRMRSCNRHCGISHSVRREHSTQNPAAYARHPQNSPV